jgi:hypothetical protein
MSVVGLQSEFNQNWNVSTGFSKLPSTKLQENPLSGPRVVALGQTDRQTDELKAQFYNFWLRTHVFVH